MLSTNQSNNFGVSCEHFKPSTPETVIHHHHLANACAHFGHKAERTTSLQRGKAGLTMNSFSSRLSRLSSTLSSNAVSIGSRLDSAISDGLASARYALMRDREYWSGVLERERKYWSGSASTGGYRRRHDGRTRHSRSVRRAGAARRRRGPAGP